MTTTEETATGQVPAAVRRATGEASWVWRRAGVRGADRRALLVELRAELQGARAEGLPLSAVLGDDARATYRAWARERDVSGRSSHAAWLVPLGLLASTLGALVLATYLITTAGGTTPLPEDQAVLVQVVLVTGAVLGVGLPVQAVWAGLASGGDPRARATALWLLVTVPVGEVVAFLLAVNVPGVVGDRFAAESVAPSVLVAMAAALLAGRWLAVRRPRPEARDGGTDGLGVPPEWGGA